MPWPEARRVARASPSCFGRSGLLGGCLGLQRVPGLLDQRAKGRLIAHGDVGEHLAVELDPGGLEALDEAAVADAGRPAGGVQAYDPEGAPFALLLLAVAVGVLPG